MSRRAGPLTTAGRQAVHLVFGENLNDALSIKELLLMFNGSVAVDARPRPTSLQRGAGKPAVDRWIGHVSDAVTVMERRGRRVASVIVHRDADARDPEGRAHEELKKQLTAISAHPVVPVQMMESWWFLFPEAVEAVRPSAWRGKLPRGARDVEAINRPFEELVRLTRGRLEYSKSDSPLVAASIRQMRSVPLGTSASFDRFKELATSLT